MGIIIVSFCLGKQNNKLLLNYCHSKEIKCSFIMIKIELSSNNLHGIVFNWKINSAVHSKVAIC